MIIDSGATISALPKNDAPLLGIDPARGSPMVVAGIGGDPIAGWRHELTVLLRDQDLKLPFVFLDAPDAPRVLGREGIFDRFTVVFEELKRRSVLLEADTQEATQISTVLDGLQ